MLKISLIVIQWIFFAYTLYRIGNKLHIKKSYPWYIIPLWNFWILAKGSEIKIKKFFLTLLFILSPLIGWFLYMELSTPSAIAIIGGADGSTAIFISNRLAPDMIGALVILIYHIAIIFFWANLAKTMGKEYEVYVLFGLFSIYLPPLLLAFNNIDKLFLSTNIYRISNEKVDINDKKINYGVAYFLIALIILSNFHTY